MLAGPLGLTESFDGNQAEDGVEERKINPVLIVIGNIGVRHEGRSLRGIAWGIACDSGRGKLYFV